MYSSPVFVAFALMAPVFAAPAPIAQLEAGISAVTAPLEARAGVVTCTPKTNQSKTKSFKISVPHARSQANLAAFKTGRSGDPHQYGGGDGIVWGVKECDAKGAPLWEYPLFWQGTKGASGQLDWEKDVKTAQQKKKTPIRVVYVNQNGGAKYCGVMTHSEVTADFQGKAFFQKCV